MTRFSQCICLVCFVLASGCGTEPSESPTQPLPQGTPTTTNAAEPTSEISIELDEPQKIEHLISSIEQLQDATFIRNGKTYTPEEAAEHMRSKWKWKKKEIVSASDFILIAATKSSMSGELYMIRFAGGDQVPVGEYLQEELNGLR